MSPPGPDFAAVDDGDAEGLVGMVDAASGWPAVRTLRAWERDRLGLVPGDRLLDVGCGPGDAAVALGLDGRRPVGIEAVGVDTSAAMLGAARRRAADAGVRLRVVRGDAGRLPVPDGSADAARGERILQWVRDPAGVVAELHRAVRPGGRVVLIDSDWSTLVLDAGDDRLAAAMSAHVAVERRRPAHVGGRLLALARDAGLVDLVPTTATHEATGWDPDRAPAPPGFPPIAGLAADLVGSGHLAAAEVPEVVAAVEDAGRAGRLAMSLTMHAVAARRP